MNKIVYIHYGHNEFHFPDPIINRDRFLTKPYGGLWASRKNGDQTWKSWCESEKFRLDTFHTCFEFTLNEKARVLYLSHEDQLDDLPKLSPFCKSDMYADCCLDFEKLEKQYDAIEVVNICHLYWRLYGWDCNSILVMNPEIIEIVGKEAFVCR